MVLFLGVLTGADVSLTAPPDPPPSEGQGDVGAGHFAGIMDARYSDMFNISGGCRVDGMAASCSLAMGLVNSGTAVVGPENTTRWNPNLNNGQGGYQFFHAWADGTQGWSPINWVPGISGTAAIPGGPPSLKNVSPEEAARRKAIVSEFGRSGSGNEGVDLSSSQDYGPEYLQYTSDNQCSIRVDFKGPGFKIKNGPGERAGAYGLGFTVSGTVTAGGIGAVDVPDGHGGSHPDPVNPHGAWTIQQWVSESAQASYGKDPKKVLYDGMAARADGPDPSYRRIEGNDFVYADFPGPYKSDQNFGNLVSYGGEWDFAVKVLNGSQQCEVKFHISMSLQDGQWNAHWNSR